MTVKVPTNTSPLAKALRTSEGILIFLVTVATVIVSAVDPSKLPPEWAAVIAATLAILHAISRVLLKIVAVQKGVGIEPPIPWEPFPVPDAGETAEVPETPEADVTAEPPEVSARPESGVKPELTPVPPQGAA